MFKKLFLFSFLRNICITIVLVPLLLAYSVTAAYRIPNAEKEALLDYIASTGDLTVLDSPVDPYGYQYAILDANGDLSEENSMDPEDPLYDEKLLYFKDLKETNFVKGGKQAFFVVTPDDIRYHHMPSEYFFSSINLPIAGTDKIEVHVIYRKEKTLIFQIISQVNTAGLVFLIAMLILGVVFAQFEIRPAKKAWKQQKIFTAHASHELRTPIFVAKMILEQFEGEDTDPYREKHQMIKRELDMMSNVVNDLMFLSRTDFKQIKVDKHVMDLADVLQDAFQSARVIAESKKISLQLSGCNRVFINADPALIRQAVGILLDNAIEYTDPNGEVTLSAQNRGRRSVITVEDTGKGIPQKEYHNIFKRFYRIDTSKGSQKGNSGMGLAIAKWIVNQHKGRIRVESEVGKGSLFIISLPITKVES